MDLESKRIVRVLIVLSTMLVGLVLYLSYFEVFKADQIESHSFNRRQWLNEELVIRGSIIDRNGKILAYSEKVEDIQSRIYKYGSLYSHIIGYSHKEYGKSGIEASYNKLLIDDESNPIRVITDKITGTRDKGNNVILTIDHELQIMAEKKLKGNKGAIVLMNPMNGEIYAMVSKPDFDPTTLKENWEDIVEDLESPLLNRATMGLYAPGSIFKIITATAVLQAGNINETYECEGSLNINGFVLNNFRNTVHGEIDLEEALAESCNVAFAQMGLQLGKNNLRISAEKYMFNKIIPFDLVTKRSLFPSTTTMTNPELGATAIGQGKLLTTPLNMALVASAIANDGLMMKPIIVKEVISPEGKSIKSNNPNTIGKVCEAEEAGIIKDMMIEVVKSGTGTNAAIKNTVVAGKTGTAQNDMGKEHAWFIGFAPAENPKVAVAVILENAGTTGGKSAAPIARDLLNAGLKKFE